MLLIAIGIFVCPKIPLPWLYRQLWPSGFWTFWLGAAVTLAGLSSLSGRQVRAWQQAADRDDQEPGGLQVAIGELNQALAEMPRRLERLKKSGLKKLSRSDEDARFLRERGDQFVLGYSAEIAVSDDHLIVAQRVTQNATDNQSLHPMLDQVELRCGAPPGSALADSGFFSIDNLNQLEHATSTAMCRTPIWRGL